MYVSALLAPPPKKKAPTPFRPGANVYFYNILFHKYGKIYVRTGRLCCLGCLYKKGFKINFLFLLLSLSKYASKLYVCLSDCSMYVRSPVRPVTHAA